MLFIRNPPSSFLKPDGTKHQKGNEDILYSKWTKTYYQGGLKEYDRLEPFQDMIRMPIESEILCFMLFSSRIIW